MSNQNTSSDKNEKSYQQQVEELALRTLKFGIIVGQNASDFG